MELASTPSFDSLPWRCSSRIRCISLSCGPCVEPGRAVKPAHNEALERRGCIVWLNVQRLSYPYVMNGDHGPHVVELLETTLDGPGNLQKTEGWMIPIPLQVTMTVKKQVRPRTYNKYQDRPGSCSGSYQVLSTSTKLG